MQKLHNSVFSIAKTTNLSPAVFKFLQPSDDQTDKTPLGGILKDTKHCWLALGPKFCVVDLRTGLKVAARVFGGALSNTNIYVTSVVELPTPLTHNSQQLVISLQNDDTGIICVLHVNGSQLLRCIQTDVVVTQLAVCDRIPDGPFICFDGVVMAGTKSGEIFAFDLNRGSLLQALKDISQGQEHLIRCELTPANLVFVPGSLICQIERQRELALENDDHLAFLLNENSFTDDQYIFLNTDGTVRMKAKRNHIRVTVLQYIPQLASLAVGYNFGAFQIWSMLTADLEFTSQVNIECLPVTHFGFQEPCDDPRAFCYLWVIFSVTDRFEEEEFPLAVMYSLTYQGKSMLSESKCLYQDFSNATIRFEVELCGPDNMALLGGLCVSCHTYSVASTLGAEGEDSMLNICQLVWECWGENPNSPAQYGMLLFDLDQWYKDQMPATCRLESNTFMSATWCSELGGDCSSILDVRLDPNSVSVYWHATRLEEHFYPNSLQYSCICLNTSEVCVVSTIGVQRQIISSIDETGPAVLLNPPPLYMACLAAGLTPLYTDTYGSNPTLEEQRRFLLSVALEARLSLFLKRCAHDWATGSHSGTGCTLTFLVDWCWSRTIQLKENAKELTAPLFSSSALPDRNVVRCLEHSVQQLTQLTDLMDSVLTKCCNLVIPDALSEMEEKYKGIGTVSLYFQVVQWFLRVGLLPERHDAHDALSYPAQQLYTIYNKRRLKLNRLQDNMTSTEDTNMQQSCPLLYIDQLIEHEFGGDRIHQMWINGGSECNGLYPPPSLYSLLRLYLLPDIAEEHKHSLVLYLLVDYSMVFDEVRYEAVIRRLMQFPTMFGLSNTAIKATQAFWHLDHRDFDFALDQLQCLTGNTLSQWQHHVVLSSLLAQKKTQAALQYLHVRKPAPLQSVMNGDGPARMNDHDKLEDWQSCCSLYLARGLVFEALDVVRMCVQNVASYEEKARVLNFFFRGCRNNGHLYKILQTTLEPLEEDVFIKYLENCDEPQTSDILIMYYLQQSRYLEAEQYNRKLKKCNVKEKEVSTSLESMFELLDRENARDMIVDVVTSSLPPITTKVARYALNSTEMVAHSHVIAPEPMSVYVQAKSPKNTFIYKSSFIQDTIENASETWMYRPKMRRGIKRALNIEETPFICTPKLTRTRRFFSSDYPSDSTPAKRAKMAAFGAARASRASGTFRPSDALSTEMATLLDMPELSPDKSYIVRAETPHSILKIRRQEAIERDAPSPANSRYFGDSDDELLETASNHTHYSDSTNKHLRFTIPTASESGSTPSPSAQPVSRGPTPAQMERERVAAAAREKEMDISTDSFVTTASHAMNDNNPLESPPKKLATEDKVKPQRTYKDNVRARKSMSISANSSLSDDPNTSIESIADIPVTLINPRYSGEKRRQRVSPLGFKQNVLDSPDVDAIEESETQDDERLTGLKDIDVPKTPKGRRSIRNVGDESSPLLKRGKSMTPERQDSPMVTLSRGVRLTRSRSRTPELSPRSSPLEPIVEQPIQEIESEPHLQSITLSVTRQLRSRSRTPERVDKGMTESPRLEPITESPTNQSSSESSPCRRSLRSRSRTPEVEIPDALEASPRSMRSRSKTPEKIISPKVPHSTKKKPLSRLVLEANTFAKSKQADKTEGENAEESTSVLECTPVKPDKQVASLIDVTLSPIVNKSVLQSSDDSDLSESLEKDLERFKKFPEFKTIQDTFYQKSVLQSYNSSGSESSKCIVEQSIEIVTANVKLPTLSSLNDIELNKSILRSYESSFGESSTEMRQDDQNIVEPFAEFAKMVDTDFERSVLRNFTDSLEKFREVTENTSSVVNSDSEVEMESEQSESRDSAAVIQKEKEQIVEIEREINEIEGDMTDEETSRGANEETSEDEEMEAEESEANNTSEESSESVEEDEEEVILINDSSESSDSNKSSKTEPESNRAETASKAVTAVDIEMNKSDETENLATNQDGSMDPLNQAQLSLMTDDNSFLDLDQTNMTLNNSEREEDNEAITEMNEKDIQSAVQVQVTVEAVEQTNTIKETPESSAVDVVGSTIITNTPENQIHITDVNSKGIEDSTEQMETSEPDTGVVIVDSEQDRYIETLSEEKQTELIQPEQIEAKPASHTRKRVKSTSSTKSVDEPIISVTRKRSQSSASNKSTTVPEQLIPENKELISDNKDITAENKELLSEDKEITSDNKDLMSEAKEITPENKELMSENREITAESKELLSENKKITPESKELLSEDKEITSDNKQLISETKEITPENKELMSENREITAENKELSSENKETTPNKGLTAVNTELTPENKQTPSRKRAKTPTSAEVRRIITRRMSREMADKSKDSVLLDDSRTPKRGSRKDVDDNESVASEGSVGSSFSKISESAGDAKSSQGRRGRKSVLPMKPELSVIPENTTESAPSPANSDIIKEYSSARRLTRNQKAVLESWLEPQPSPRNTRRTSLASRASVISEQDSHEDDDASSTHSTFDVQPMDRISLLYKKDFDGQPDVEECQNEISPASIASDANAQWTSRLGRAASESKTTPKAAKVGRRVSVDVAGLRVGDSPLAGGESPGRSRRASFNKACEALLTPKGRRTSIDAKGQKLSSIGETKDSKQK